MLKTILNIIKKILNIKDEIIITNEFRDFFDKLNSTNNNYFITGHAGTGKSTFIEYFRTHTNKKVAVIAPTGIAAINVRGQTIHSFFKFPPRMITKQVINNSRYSGRLYKELDTIIIDEASMVRADMLDGIDLFLRKQGKDKNLPYGGIQVILVGDLFQLPPVVTGEEKHILSRQYLSPYFFSSASYSQGNFETLILTEIFRQKDQDFIEVLNEIRTGDTNQETFQQLNKQVKNNQSILFTKKAVTLTTTNYVAEQINKSELDRINNTEYVFEAIIEGNFPTENRSLPVDIKLHLKKGARVMFVKNDKGGRWVNGTLGKVVHVDDNDIRVKIDGSNKQVVVEKDTWENVKYDINNSTNDIEEKVVGKLIQYPIRLAWAITIHKSQGMTFERVNIDYSKSPFAHGQTYVALSRCKTLSGITLSKKLYSNDVIVDERIIEFIR